MSLKPSLSGAPPAELENMLSPLPAYRARQIFAWITRGARSFDMMNDLPLALRRELDGRFCLRKTAVLNTFYEGGTPLSGAPDNGGSNNGAAKLQISVDGGVVEAVALADGAFRRTACLSAQLGCPEACVFCKTGSMGFIRNLDSAEIIEQFYHIRDLFPDIANIVFMGMGEPLLNLAALRRSIAVLCQTMSPRRITVSTCGLADGIESLADDGPAVRLAVSLTTAREDLRGRLMPVSAANPLCRLKEALLYHQRRQGRRITLEAVLLGGLNTGAEDAAAMATFAAGLNVVVNLIPWNPVDGIRFEGGPLKEPSAAEVERFQSRLEELGLKTALRRRKGRGITGACGQLGARRIQHEGGITVLNL